MNDGQLKRLLQFLEIYKRNGSVYMHNHPWLKPWHIWIKEGSDEEEY